jgi:serine protease SohB
MLNWMRDRVSRGPVVPVVRLSGVIAAGGLLGARGLSIEQAAPLLARAFAQRNAKAVALVINSPGGSPVQSALIAQRIRLLAQEKNLPVIAFVEDVAASGGYWIACAADEIVADGASIVGSIGVVS